MRKLLGLFVVTGLIPLLQAQAKPKELLAAVISVSGECFYEREGKTIAARTRTIFFRSDRLYTKKGKMDVQIGPTAVLHLAPYTAVRLSDISEADAKTKIQIDLEAGRSYTKFSKPMSPGSQYVIKSPTLVAGVRGTEFILSAGDSGADSEKNEDSDIPAGVFVNHGKVAVSLANQSGDAQILEQGQQITTVDNALVKGVIEDFLNKKMTLFKHLDCMKEAQYKIMEREKQRQIDTFEKVRNSVKINDAKSGLEQLQDKRNNMLKK